MPDFPAPAPPPLKAAPLKRNRAKTNALSAPQATANSPLRAPSAPFKSPATGARQFPVDPPPGARYATPMPTTTPKRHRQFLAVSLQKSHDIPVHPGLSHF